MELTLPAENVVLTIDMGGMVAMGIEGSMFGAYGLLNPPLIVRMAFL